MRQLLTSLVVGSLFYPCLAAAIPLAISIEPKIVSSEAGDTKREPFSASLVLEPLAETASDTASFEIEVPDGLELDLPTGTWSIRFEAEDFWARPRQIQIGEEPVAVEIEAWPAGRLAGQVVAQLVRPPWQSSAAHPFPAIPPQTHTDVDGLFALDLPAGVDRVMLQVFPPGFVPILAEVERDAESPLILQTTNEAGNLRVHFDRPPDNLLHSDPPGALGRGTFIFYEGLPLGNGTLLASVWNRMNGVGNPHRDQLQIGRLAPGAYTVCWGGVAASQGKGSCFEGYLPALGTLEIVIPHGVLLAASALAAN